MSQLKRFVIQNWVFFFVWNTHTNSGTHTFKIYMSAVSNVTSLSQAKYFSVWWYKCHVHTIWNRMQIPCFLYSLAVFIQFIKPYANCFCQVLTAPSAFYPIKGDMFGLPWHLWPTAWAQRWLTGGGEMSRYKHALHFPHCTFPHAPLISSKTEPRFLMAVFSNSKQDRFLLRSPLSGCVQNQYVPGSLSSYFALLWYFMVSLGAFFLLLGCKKKKKDQQNNVM